MNINLDLLPQHQFYLLHCYLHNMLHFITEKICILAFCSVTDHVFLTMTVINLKVWLYIVHWIVKSTCYRKPVQPIVVVISVVYRVFLVYVCSRIRLFTWINPMCPDSTKLRCNFADLDRVMTVNSLKVFCPLLMQKRFSTSCTVVSSRLLNDKSPTINKFL